MSTRKVRMTSSCVATVGKPPAEKSFLCTRTYTLIAADAEELVANRKAVYVDNGPEATARPAKAKRTTPPPQSPPEPSIASETKPK